MTFVSKSTSGPCHGPRSLTVLDLTLSPRSCSHVQLLPGQCLVSCIKFYFLCLVPVICVSCVSTCSLLPHYLVCIYRLCFPCFMFPWYSYFFGLFVPVKLLCFWILWESPENKAAFPVYISLPSPAFGSTSRLPHCQTLTGQPWSHWTDDLCFGTWCVLEVAIRNKVIKDAQQ